MVQKKHVRTALTVAALASHNAMVEAQDDLRREGGQVCGFTVRATAFENQNVGYIDNDIPAINTPQNGLFYVSNQEGRLYNARGERCGFDPYLECDTDSEPDTNRSPFTIEANGTIAFQGQNQFYLCARGAFQRCGATGDQNDCDDDSSFDGNQDDLGDNPRIYPPVGTTSNRQRDFQNCTLTQLVASQCFGDNTGNTFVPPASALQSSTVPQQTSNAGSGNIGTRNNVARMAAMNSAGKTGAKDSLVTSAAIFVVMAFVYGGNALL